MRKPRTKIKRFFTFISLGTVMLIMALAWSSSSALACDFYFNYEKIKAPVGTTGEVGVQVVKTHNRCTMEDPLGYSFDGENIQILAETEWEKVDSNVYQKWLRITLTSPGEGFLRISATCSKEGYQEAILPVLVTEK